MKKIILIIGILLINFVSAASYGSGIYGGGLYGTGENATIPPAEEGGGGGGCTYDWDCTNWFPPECPVSGIQERICVNRGTCTGTLGMPNQTQTCVYEHKEPLFDIFLTIPEQSEEVCAGGKIRANVKLENYGEVELLDAFMTYWVIDENNKLISEVKDTRNVADKLDFDISINIPRDTNEGVYRLYAQITYSGNKTAVAGESFKIIDEYYCQIFFNISEYLPVILIGLGLLILIIFILLIILFRRFRHHTKKEPTKIRTKISKGTKPEKISFAQKRKINLMKRKKERERKRILREIEKQKRITARENIKLKKEKEKLLRLKEKKNYKKTSKIGKKKRRKKSEKKQIKKMIEEVRSYK